MKVLFLDKNHEYLQEKLTKSGFDVVDDFYSTKQELIENLDGIEGIVVRSRFTIDEQFLSAAKDLKFIGRVGAGMENIDLAYAYKRNIKCYKAPEGNQDAVAEHAVGQLLMLLNRLHHLDWQVKNGIWKREENRGYELKGKTVGILGYGYMGKAFAKRLSGFGVKVICFDIKENLGDSFAEQQNMSDFFAKTEVLSIHLPLDISTIGLVDYNYIQSFAKPIYIINTARGKCLPLADLNKAMEEKQVLGACLDVLEVEKTSFEDLYLNTENKELNKALNNDKIIFSPHVAGWTHESKIKLDEIIAQQIVRDFG